VIEVGDNLLLRGEDEQRAFGAALAPLLPVGGVLFLEGELGSGKTTLTQGLAAALGFGGRVNSPTYALMHDYPAAQGRLLHVDAYRLRHPQELYEMDFERLVQESRLSVVEWGQAFYADFPDAWVLRLGHGADTESRTLERLR
jgi:tRNA threonylcarbamoyladenosine biosynthesis protein TsaE